MYLSFFHSIYTFWLSLMFTGIFHKFTTTLTWYRNRYKKMCFGTVCLFNHPLGKITNGISESSNSPGKTWLPIKSPTPVFSIPALQYKFRIIDIRIYISWIFWIKLLLRLQIVKRAYFRGDVLFTVQEDWIPRV